MFDWERQPTIKSLCSQSANSSAALLLNFACVHIVIMLLVGCFDDLGCSQSCIIFVFDHRLYMFDAALDRGGGEGGDGLLPCRPSCNVEMLREFLK